MAVKKNTKKAQTQRKQPQSETEAKTDDTSEQPVPVAESSKAAQSRQSSEHLIPPVATIENAAEPYEASELSDEEVDQLMPSSDRGEEPKEVSNEEHKEVPDEGRAEGLNEEHAQASAEGPDEATVEVPAHTEDPPQEPTGEGPTEEPTEKSMEKSKKNISPKVRRWEDCHWPNRYSYRGHVPQAEIEVVKTYDRSKPGFDLVETINKEVWPDYPMCSIFTSQIKGETATGALFHRTDGRDDGNSAAKFLFAGLSRTQRDVESMPLGSKVSGGNLTSRMKRNAAFWVRQQDMLEYGYAVEYQTEVDIQREQAWALDVVHDAVPEWTPELADAFKAICTAAGVKADEIYPDTFQPPPPPPPVEESEPEEEAPPAPPAKGRKGKGKKRARKGDEADEGDACAPGTAANGRRVRARKSAAAVEPPVAKKAAAKKTKAAPRRGKGRK